MKLNRVYFDNAATTAVDPEVLDTMMPYLTEKFGNPSSVCYYGRETRMAIEGARKSVAKILNASPSEIFFTSGGTESSNTAITASVRDLGCQHIITSAIEHHATLHTVQQQGIPVSYTKLLADGHIDMNHLEKLLAVSERSLVSLMHANNEIGNITDIHAVGDLCKKYKAIFHSDTVQTVGHFPIDLKNTNVDFITGSAHKFHGPKGVGILYINENIKIKPFVHGGSQERNMRAGTENLYGIVGFAKALEIATANYEKDKDTIQALNTYMMNKLKLEIPSVVFNGDPYGKSLYKVLSVSFEKSERSGMLLFNLDMHNICASGGSACNAGSDGGSHVIKAIGNTDQPTIRFSFSKNNTIAEVDYVVQTLKELI